jgi:hypothetical protein
MLEAPFHHLVSKYQKSAVLALDPAEQLDQKSARADEPRSASASSVATPRAGKPVWVARLPASEQVSE